MTNKPMLSVELRALLERMLSEPASNASYGNLQDRAELRALLSRSEGWVPCSPGLLESGVDCATSPRWSSKEWDGHSHWHPATIADHTQCEECKGWGYHENHHEGGGTECGECSGSGKAPVEQFSGDTVVCRRYQLEQSPGQNFYHYDLEPVYGSVPVTVSELITLAESAPPAVVMPEPYGLAMFKMLSGFDSVTPEQFNLVWTACRKEVARLNGVKP